MIPIYFPFTFLSEAYQKALNVYFDEIVIYQPTTGHVPLQMLQRARDGFLSIRYPFSGDSNHVESIIRDYKTWADLHNDNGISSYKEYPHSIPFFDDSTTSHIRSDIKEYGRKTDKQHEVDGSVKACVFLQMAQEYDIDQGQFTRNLQSFNEMEKRFTDSLGVNAENTSKTNAFPKEMVKSGNSGYMIQERITAWARLFQKDPCDEGLFISFSQPVRAFIADRFPEMETAIVIDDLHLGENERTKKGDWKAVLSKIIEATATDFWKKKSPHTMPINMDVTEKSSVSLTLYIIPEQTPRQVIARCSEQTSVSPIKSEPTPYRNTLIGMVETSGNKI